MWCSFVSVGQQHCTVFTRRRFMEQRCWNLKIYKVPNPSKYVSDTWNTFTGKKMCHIFVCFGKLVKLCLIALVHSCGVQLLHSVYCGVWTKWEQTESGAALFPKSLISLAVALPYLCGSTQTTTTDWATSPATIWASSLATTRTWWRLS